MFRAYFFPERMRVGVRMEEKGVRDSEYAKVRGKRKSYLRNYQWFCVARTENLNGGVVGVGKWKNLWLEKKWFQVLLNYSDVFDFS